MAGKKGRSGRPTKYTPELVEKLLERIRTNVSLLQVCNADDMPERTTVYAWCDKYPDFKQQFAKAMEIGCDARAEECLNISDNPDGDPARDRLRVDTRKWFLSKLAPRKYGDKVQQQISGVDGEPIKQQIKIEIVGVAPK